MHSEQLIEAALGLSAPWYVRAARFDGGARKLTLEVDFRPRSRFSDARPPAVVHERRALEGRADESGRSHDPQSSGGYRRLARSRMTNGFLEARNGLFRAAERKARCCHQLVDHQNDHVPDRRKIDFRELKPHVA